jgi:hypothetical protein
MYKVKRNKIKEDTNKNEIRALTSKKLYNVSVTCAEKTRNADLLISI